MASGLVIHKYSDGNQYFNPHSRATLAWSPDGKFLAEGISGSDFAKLIIWDMARGSIIQTFTGYTDCSWSPDSKRIALPNVNTFDIATIATGVVNRHSLATAYYTGPLAWSPDGKYIAIGGNIEYQDTYYIVEIYAANGGGILKACPERYFISNVDAIAWSPDGKFIAVVKDNTVEIWQMFV